MMLNALAKNVIVTINTMTEHVVWFKIYFNLIKQKKQRNVIEKNHEKVLVV
jgi:hypothetical protein